MTSQDPKQPGEPTAAPDETAVELSLEDTLAQQKRGLLPAKSVPAPPVGYNPYDVPPNLVAGKAAKADKKARKPTDLRKLSEWIRLQRQVAALKDKEEESK